MGNSCCERNSIDEMKLFNNKNIEPFYFEEINLSNFRTEEDIKNLIKKHRQLEKELREKNINNEDDLKNKNKEIEENLYYKNREIEQSLEDKNRNAEASLEYKIQNEEYSLEYKNRMKEESLEYKNRNREESLENKIIEAKDDFLNNENDELNDFNYKISNEIEDFEYKLNEELNNLIEKLDEKFYDLQNKNRDEENDLEYKNSEKENDLKYDDKYEDANKLAYINRKKENDLKNKHLIEENKIKKNYNQQILDMKNKHKNLRNKFYIDIQNKKNSFFQNQIDKKQKFNQKQIKNINNLNNLKVSNKLNEFKLKNDNFNKLKQLKIDNINKLNQLKEKNKKYEMLVYNKHRKEEYNLQNKNKQIEDYLIKRIILKNYQEKYPKLEIIKEEEEENENNENYENNEKFENNENYENTQKNLKIPIYTNLKTLNKSYSLPRNINTIHDIAKTIGEGGFGKLMKVKTVNGISAMKIIFPDIDNMTDIFNEINIMKLMNHPNIVKYYGYNFYKNNFVIIMEFCKGGDLFNLYKTHPNLNIKFKINVIKQLANALLFIHSQNIIHGDLKCLNILLDKNYNENDNDFPNIKVCDFGLSKFSSEPLDVKGYSILWVAPESLNDNINTKESDIYQFASTCYELLSQNLPYANECDDSNQVKKKIINGEHPNLNLINCNLELKNLLKNCWNINAMKRPKINEIVYMLNNLKF